MGLKLCDNVYDKNTEMSEFRISLAEIYEDLGKFKEALEQYKKIEEKSYLKPESIAGIARISEINGNMDEAIDHYTKLHSHYVNTYWGHFASERLAVLGVKPKEKKDYVPDIQVK